MEPALFPVTFAPAAVTVWVSPGTTIAEAAKDACLLVSTPCGGRGICAGCGVHVIGGELQAPDAVERQALKRAPKGIRLACRARVAGPVEIRPLFATAMSGPSATAVTSQQPAAGQPLVAGVDLGTTSVASVIVEAGSGREVGRASVANLQASFGADVLSRVSAALRGEAADLRALGERSVIDALQSAAATAGVELAQVERVVVAANSAMGALLVGADVSSLAAYPFSPPAPGGPLPGDSQIFFAVAPGTEASLVPPIAAFVGGDALAAIVAAGLIDVDEASLLVDLGTNAEIVLALPGSLLVASTAAGPAFEGAGISCGGPATAGAVDHVEISGERVLLHAMGDAEPRWFSGAGLISAIAGLVAVGHITADGAMLDEGPLARRFSRDDKGVLGVRLSADGAASIVLSQLDVRAVQLAKAAVRAGIQTLLRRAGVSADALSEVLVAGAFGAALAPADLVAIGVLPSNSPHPIRRVGNAALDGAAAIALNPGLTTLAERTAKRAIHVDLALDGSFSADFMAATEFCAYEA